MKIALVLEDDTFSAMALNALLEDEGFTVRWFSDTDRAAEHISSELPDIIIADWQIDGSLTSAELIKRIRRERPAVIVALVTGYSIEDVRAAASGIDPYLHFSKPLDYDDFLTKIKSA